MKRLLLNFAFLFALLPVAASAEANWDAARQVVEKVTDDMVTILKQGVDVNDEASLESTMTTIEQKLDPVVDFDYIARRVMGKYYRRANDEERARFADVFRHTMVKTYTKALAGFEIDHVEVVPPTAESPEPDKQIVTLDVYSGNGTKYTLVNYMLERDGKWNLVNVVVDGVNLRLTFSSQFADLAERNHGNIDDTITNWKTMVESKPVKTGGADAGQG